MDNSDELSSQVASCIKAYLLFPSPYILTTLESIYTTLGCLHFSSSPGVSRDRFWMLFRLPEIIFAHGRMLGKEVITGHGSWPNWCHGWAMAKPMWVSNFNQSQWQSDKSVQSWALWKEWKPSARNFQHPTGLFFLVTLFIIFERQESQANVAELHCILHRDRITATIFQTGMVCQGLNVAGYCDLDAHRSLWHFEHLGEITTCVQLETCIV